MKTIPILILICLVHLSCEKDDYKRVGMVQIEDAMIPDTALVDELVQITVKAAATDLCWSDLYVELKEENPFAYSIRSYGTFSCGEGGCACPQQMLFKDTILTLQPTAEGNYFFNIWETERRVVIDTMIVI